MPTRFLLAALAVLLAVAPVAAGQSELVIYKEGTGLYHRPGCPVLKEAADTGAGGDIVAMTRAQAEGRGHKAHAACDPDQKKTEGAPAQGSPPTAVTVYVIDARYYHRKDCPKLKDASKQVKSAPLETAGKSHWPCPTCRPPVRKKSAEPAVPGTGRRGG
jgi:hypothetical protein